MVVGPARRLARSKSTRSVPAISTDRIVSRAKFARSETMQRRIWHAKSDPRGQLIVAVGAATWLPEVSMPRLACQVDPSASSGESAVGLMATDSCSPRVCVDRWQTHCSMGFHPGEQAMLDGRVEMEMRASRESDGDQRTIAGPTRISKEPADQDG
jgi:hypothetical protein